MTAPRIEIDLGKIRQNTRCLVRHLGARGITVTGVTKAVCGNPDIAKAMLEGGAIGIADARLRNVVRMRKAGIGCPITIIRTPMQSEVGQIIQCCETSYNTQMETITELAAAARHRGVVHNVVLVVEMGDMRDGIMPEDLEAFASQVAELPGVAFKGIAANFACLGDIAPGAEAMTMLSRMASEVEGSCGPFIELVSGGSSVNLPWALSAATTGRINNLRLGEAIFLGVEPLSGKPIEGLHTDAFTLVAEVVETKHKPGSMRSSTFGSALKVPRLVQDDDRRIRSILAIGQQDTDAGGLRFPAGVDFLGATSDHTVVDTTNSSFTVGSEMKLRMTYSALMRAMSAPDVAKIIFSEEMLTGGFGVRLARPRAALV